MPSVNSVVYRTLARLDLSTTPPITKSKTIYESTGNSTKDTQEHGTMEKINPRSDEQRAALKLLGFPILIIGIIMTAVGINASFTHDPFGDEPGDGLSDPDEWWYPFVGMPLIFVGLAMLSAAYMGTMARYSAGETMPVAKDSINYLADGTQEGMKAFSKAIGEGLAEGMKEGELGAVKTGTGSSEKKGTVRERLEKLDSLRDDGLIDNQDYEEQKDRILNDL